MLFPKLKRLLFFPDKPRTLKARGRPDIEGSTVRMEGLEPPRLSAPDPKSGTATNYATSACSTQSIEGGVMMASDPKSAPTCRGTIPIAIGNATSALKLCQTPGRYSIFYLERCTPCSNYHLASLVPVAVAGRSENSLQFRREMMPST